MKAVILALSALPCLLAFASPPARADTLEELTQRIEDLERQQQENTRAAAESNRTVHSFLDDHLSLGGFFESALTELHGPATDFQLTTASNTLGLNLAGEFNDQLRFASQFLAGLNFPLYNFDNNPAGTALGLPARRTFGTVTPFSALTQAYLEYGTNEALQVQAGLGYAPFGYALQQRELVLFIRRSGPQLLRLPGLAEALWTGVHVHGSKATRGGRIGYNLYTLTPLEDGRLIGAGGRAWWQTTDEDAVVGVSAQRYRASGRNSQVLGLDVEGRSGPLLVHSEYARNFTAGRDSWTAYVEPTYAFSDGDWIGYTYLDYGDAPLNRTTAGAASIVDPVRRLEYGAGVNWLPTAATRLRLGFYYFNYLGSTAAPAGANRDFMATDASVAVAF